MNVLDESVKTEGWKDDLKIAKWRLLRLMLDRVSPPLPGFYISKLRDLRDQIERHRTSFPSK
jgi:hypothetical protein